MCKRGRELARNSLSSLAARASQRPTLLTLPPPLSEIQGHWQDRDLPPNPGSRLPRVQWGSLTGPPPPGHTFWGPRRSGPVPACVPRLRLQEQGSRPEALPMDARARHYLLCTQSPPGTKQILRPFARGKKSARESDCVRARRCKDEGAPGSQTRQGPGDGVSIGSCRWGSCPSVPVELSWAPGRLRHREPSKG